MATIPTFEELLLEIHQSLGLKFAQKDKRKLVKLEKPLVDHLGRVEYLLEEIFTAFGMDDAARADAMLNIVEWANFDKTVELNTWTFNAGRRQILWHMSGYSYAHAMGRRLAFWALHERLDKGMPGGRFWFLPAERVRDDGVHWLVMPVAQVVNWLRDLLGAPMERAREGLGGQAAQARQQQLDDAGEKTDVHATMARELDNWRQGRLPHASTIEKYFPDDACLDFKGTLQPTPDAPLAERLRRANAFVTGKKLDADALRDEIPMTEPGRLEAVLACTASDDVVRRFVELVEERWSAPSMATIRRRLLVARMVQDGYRRLGRFLQGDQFDEQCADAAQNKVLQLLALFKLGYNLTIQAVKESSDPRVQDAWFDSQLPPWDKEGIFMAIAPSRHATGSLELAGLLTRAFADLHPDSPLEDLIGHDEASVRVIVEREHGRIIGRAAERAAIHACIAALTRGSPYQKLQRETDYWVLTQVAQSETLPARIREMACIRAQQQARTPSEALGAIILQLHGLFHGDRAGRPKNMRQQVEQLLALAEASPAYGEWDAVLLQYRAKHHLALNDFEAARKMFNAALDACHLRNYGVVRGEIARDAFAVVVERPPLGFSLGNYEGYLRNMLAFGAVFPGDNGAPITLQDTASEVSGYFWECLYAPYPGEHTEEPFARRHTEAIIGSETMELVLHGDWDGLDAWMHKNAELRDKRLRQVQGETVLTIWLGGLYRARTQQSRWSEIGPIEQVAPVADTLVRNLRAAIERLVKKWPKLINLADFKKQTPLLLAARHGDTMMVDLLLAGGADADWRDWEGKTALDHALVSGVAPCAVALRRHS
jgi:hypothetical protein